MTDEDLRTLYSRLLVHPSVVKTSEPHRCVSEDELLLLIERRGSEGERLALLDRVMSCDQCRHRFELLRSFHQAAEPRPVRWRPIALAASILVAGGLVIGGVRLVSRNAVEEPMRGATSDIGIVSPRETVPEASAHALVWRQAPGALRYTVSMISSDGTKLYSGTTPDTTLTVPSSVHLPAGQTVEWWVRAEMSDGTRRESVPVKVIIAR
ncbi:MAG TPA: hypothetical protein VEI06_00420 [Gemmatimonadaceae bacterium]|nr:hypothetical protein [Gemmatimonadaceae bacterium]